MSGWRRLVLAWFDRGALVAAALLLAGQLAVAARDPQPAEAAGLPALVDGLVRYYETDAAAPALPPAPDASPLRHALAPEAVPAAAPLPGWVLHKRPNFLFEVTPPPPPPPLRHDAPAVAVLGVGHGWVELEATPPTLLRLVPVGLELQRQEADGSWTPVATLAAPALRWTDRSVPPSSRRRYRVVSRARLDREDPAVRAAGLTRAPAELEVRASGQVEARVPADLRLRLASVTPPRPLAQQAGSAQLAVERWDPSRGEFVRRWVQTEVGQPVAETTWTLVEVGVDRTAVAGRPRSVGWAVLRRGEDELRLREDP